MTAQHYRCPSILVLASLAIGSLCSQDGRTATTCVASASALQTALVAAGSNGEADDVRLQSGTYALAGPLFYAPTDAALTTVSGGWNANCSVQSGDPALSVLDGGGSSQILGFNAAGNANLTLSTMTLQNGHATTAGACLYVHTSGGIEIDNARITGCQLATYYGGAMFVAQAGSVTLSHVTIDHNIAPSGAGIQIASAGSISIDQSDFHMNQVLPTGVGSATGSALATGGFGGPDPVITITGTSINDNTGGALSGGGPSIDIENSQFANNASIDSSLTDECGYLTSGDPNKPPAGSITIRHSTFRGTGSPGGSCFHLGASDGKDVGAIGTLQISGSVFTGFTFGAVSTLFSTSAAIDNTAFVNNSGYAALESVSPSIEIKRSRFSGNTAQVYAAAIEAQQEVSALTIDNSVFDHNVTTGNGGAIAVNLCGGVHCNVSPTASITLTNNTFVGNSAGQFGGGVWLASVFDTSPSIALWNNLFWQNTAGSHGSDIYFDDDADGNFIPTPLTLSNNAYDPAAGLFIRVFEAPLGGSNVSVGDPQFIAPASGNYRLESTSPMIDLGSLTAPALGDTDAGGMPRVYNTAPDIGAFEFNADIIFRSGFQDP